MLALLYGVVAYAGLVAVFLYAIGFLGNLGVPRSLDFGGVTPEDAAVLVDLALLGAFALPHSVMARPGFKRLLTRVVPPAVERSTFVLAAGLLLALLFWQWRPLPGTVWHVESLVGRGVLHGLFWLGWLLVLTATFLVGHLDLFGLRQVWLHRNEAPYRHPPLRTTALYGFVRHPMMLGFLLAFWATPEMTRGHLLFAGAASAYVVLGTLLEERDLASLHGASWTEYRRSVPMLVPLPGGRAWEAARAAAEGARWVRRPHPAPASSP